MKDCTAVRVASISKVFTALMIAEQVENEKIKFSEKIQEYIDYPEKCSDILISDLLSHKSGTRHYRRG
jgi:CubicO group peptidase (beta-lactamase class C family)